MRGTIQKKQKPNPKPDRGLLFQDPTVCQKTIHPMETTAFQPASERTDDNNHNMNSHYLLIFHP
jgi:hypothetical protein